MLRKRIHQLIDEIPNEKLSDLLDILQDYQKYDTYIPRLDGLPVFEMGNPEHGKILMDKYGPNTNTNLALVLEQKNSQHPKE